MSIEARTLNNEKVKLCPECGGIMVEDKLFSSGAVTMVGNLKDGINKETRYVCKQCKFVEYVPESRC